MFGAASCTTAAPEDRLPPTHAGFASGGPSVFGDSGALAPNEIARFTQTKLTAASLDLPLGTTVTVTNQENGKSVDVEVNDRGPYVDGRVIDLSKMAAKRIGIIRQGVAPVTIEAKPSRQATKELKDAVLEKAVLSVSDRPPSIPRMFAIREPSSFDQAGLKFP
jgi:rare lipoprotein A (peptidoglycan hydrolase)